MLCNMEITRDGELLVTGGKQIIVRRLCDLAVINTYSLTQPTRILYFTLSLDEQQVFAALENRRLQVFAGESTLRIGDEKQ